MADVSPVDFRALCPCGALVWWRAPRVGRNAVPQCDACEPMPNAGPEFDPLPRTGTFERPGMVAPNLPPHTPTQGAA